MKLKEALIKIAKIDIENPKRDLLFIGFSIIGMLCDIGLFNILKSELSFREWMANAISYPLGVFLTFILNYRFNYQNKSYPVLRFMLVLVAHGASLGLQLVLMHQFAVTKLVTIIINGILMWFTRLFFNDDVIAKIIKFYHHLKRLLASDS